MMGMTVFDESKVRRGQPCNRAQFTEKNNSPPGDVLESHAAYGSSSSSVRLVTTEELVSVARGMLSDEGENPEYDRAILELVAYSMMSAAGGEDGTVDPYLVDAETALGVDHDEPAAKGRVQL